MTRFKSFIAALILLALAASSQVYGQHRKVPLRADNPPNPFFPNPADNDSIFWLHYDDGAPLYYFPLPDQYDDHYFNVRFTSPGPGPCRLLRAAFLFRRMPGDTSSIFRDINILVFKGSTGNLPSAHPDSVELDSVHVPWTEVRNHPETTYVDLSNDTIQANAHFHVGWEPDTTSNGVWELWSDDGNPETTYSCEWWGIWQGDTINAWGTMFEDWNLGVNFMLRVEIETLTLPTGVRQWLDPDRPAAFELFTPSPNPFNASTVLRYELRVPSHVSLQVYDTAGRLVATLVDERQPAGMHTATFDGANLASGIYLVRLQAGGFPGVEKVVLLK